MNNSAFSYNLNLFLSARKFPAKAQRTQRQYKINKDKKDKLVYLYYPFLSYLSLFIYCFLLRLCWR
jgi:hypothetical protein